MPTPARYVKIQYPRKCNECDYVSNNPQMWHYHKRVHLPIPDGKLCDGGCGQLAKAINTNNRYMCSVVSQHCPSYIKEHSARVSAQWKGAEERKQQTKELLIKNLHNKETIEKMTLSKRKKTGILTPEQMKDYKHYARRIRSQAQAWAKEQGYVLGNKSFHVDHKLSILDAWHAKLSIEVVNHPANLQVLPYKENCSKGHKSSLTVEELLESIKTFSN